MKTEAERAEIKEKRLSILSVLSMALVLLLLLAAFVVAMNKLRIIELPEFIEKLLGTDTNSGVTVLPGDDGKIYEALINGNVPTSYGSVEYDINKVDMAKALKETSPCDTYSASFKLNLSQNGASKEQTIKVWRFGLKYRIEINEGNTLIKTIVSDGETVTVTNHVTFLSESSMVYRDSDNFTFDEQAQLPSISDIFDEESVTDLSVSLLRTESDNVYYAEYKSNYGYSEKLFVSLEYGIVVRAESSDENGVFYSLECLSLSYGIPSDFDVNNPNPA